MYPRAWWLDDEPEADPVDENPEPEVAVDGAAELHDSLEADAAAGELVDARQLAAPDLFWASPVCGPRRGW